MSTEMITETLTDPRAADGVRATPRPEMITYARLDLRRAVVDGEGDVMHRARAEIGTRHAGKRPDVDEVGAIAVRPHRPLDALVALGVLVAHELE